MNLVHSIKKRVREVLFGQPSLQLFLERCFLPYLHAMGYGEGSNPSSSGEMHVLKQVQKQSKQSHATGTITIFDVGAHTGNYTKLVLDTFGENDVSIYAFEPARKTCTSLIKNVPSTIQAFNIGFGDKKERKTLHCNDTNTLTASLFARVMENPKHAFNASELVQIETIDDFCTTHRIGHITLLKLDTEGNELRCLQGAARMLGENRIDFIQFEFGGCNIDSKTFFRDFYRLLSEKYKLYRVMQHGLFEIRNYTVTREIFTTTNYLAVRR